MRRLDTSDLSSVRAFAKEVLHTEKAIHVLVGEGLPKTKHEERVLLWQRQ